MEYKEYTIKQLLIAAGIARRLQINEICRIAEVGRVYYYKLIKRNDFVILIENLRAIPYDKDTKEYRGLGTLYMDIAKLLYSIGEKNVTN